ncbi:hypothetical protein Y032_0123g1162 [Ancylostoma ceylanicum]|uniref:Secreted protein n=1 Tax=Ancylostoma ceylanicum TaxID=53326 RepID=A0A016T9L5_9BILA|nr:hypothetical protein Y032_0123g1162 [Ancylostoma ceylanicum]
MYDWEKLLLLLATIHAANGVVCLYGSNNGWNWRPTTFQGCDNKFCLNITMPVDVGESTLYLCDVYNMCQVTDFLTFSDSYPWSQKTG